MSSIHDNQLSKSDGLSKSHAWFNQARYGMFIHWGAYSAAARGEWVSNRERIPKEEYIRLYVDNFRAEQYDPSAWAALAKDAGMGYAVLTTRHHDGFALWPTKADDFHAGRLGPKRDLVGPFVEAFRSAGLKVGFYYSPASWFHPDYPGAYYRDWPGDSDWRDEEARLRFIEFYRAQLIELMKDYGKIDYLWYDGCIPNNLQSQVVNEEVLRLQPDILINERNGPPSHVHISEQAIKPGPKGQLWEACMTLNRNWGYHAGDYHWKNAASIIQMLCETANKGGNLLLNIGPKADGSVPEESAKMLHQAGDWLKRNGASIYGTEHCPFSWNNWGLLTMRGNKVYLIVICSPGKTLCLAEVKNRVLSARYLDGGGEISFQQEKDRLFLHDLVDPLPDPLGTVIEIEVEGYPEPLVQQTSFWIPG